MRKLELCWVDLSTRGALLMLPFKFFTESILGSATQLTPLQLEALLTEGGSSRFWMDIRKPLSDDMCKSLKRWRCSISALKLKQKVLYCFFFYQIIHSTENVDIVGLFKHHPKKVEGKKEYTDDGLVKSKCLKQPGSTECGYYVLKFMKEIVEQGIQVLEYDNIGEGKEEYTDDDLDEVREEWANFVANFIFRP